MDRLNSKLKKDEERIEEPTDVFEEITQNIEDKEVENTKEMLNSLKDRPKA